MYQIWPCYSVGQLGHFLVGTPGGQPVFVNGSYHWPKEQAEAIARRLNAG